MIKDYDQGETPLKEVLLDIIVIVHVDVSIVIVYVDVSIVDPVYLVRVHTGMSYLIFF